MNLPQEYWEKQTLLEIASSLETPLAIDEATQFRRFGIFARVLIDVDLSENLFESIVVELEDHALSILVQYEKHPLYCAHCKVLGHNIQNCSKLHSLDNSESGHQKPTTLNYNDKLKAGIDACFGQKQGPKVTHKSSTAQRNNLNAYLIVNKVVAATVIDKVTPALIDLNEDNFDSTADFEDGECSIQNTTDPGIQSTDHHPMVQHKHTGNKLKLHNSFELLDTGVEQVKLVTRPELSGDQENPPLYWICTLIKI